MRLQLVHTLLAVIVAVSLLWIMTNTSRADVNVDSNGNRGHKDSITNGHVSAKATKTTKTHETKRGNHGDKSASPEKHEPTNHSRQSQSSKGASSAPPKSRTPNPRQHASSGGANVSQRHSSGEHNTSSAPQAHGPTKRDLIIKGQKKRDRQNQRPRRRSRKHPSELEHLVGPAMDPGR